MVHVAAKPTSTASSHPIKLAKLKLSFDLAAASAYAAIAAQRRRADQALSAADGMVAAIARTHGAAVATRDRVPLVNPWEAL